MPFVSKAQERYFFANKKKLEAQGVDVNEWAQASKGMNLPDKAYDGRTKNMRRLGLKGSMMGR